MNVGTLPESEAWWIPKRRHETELIDDFDQPLDDLRSTFREIQRCNRLFGGTTVVLNHLARLIGSDEEPITVLDVATGFGDIPRDILKWSRENRMSLNITGLDANERMLRLAEEEAQGDPNFHFVLGDAGALPFEDASFDFVTSSLAFHHFEDPFAVTALKEMMRVAKRGIIVNDLRRGYIPAALIWTISRVFRMNRLIKNDAPLSVLRSRTMQEFKALVDAAGLSSAKVYKHPFWRAAIVARKLG